MKLTCMSKIKIRSCFTQVNNPVSILNQEMSKKFLASTDPSSKYNFFMKSTHLEQMILDYQVQKCCASI